MSENPEEENAERRIPRLTEKGRIYEIKRKKSECESIRKKIKRAIRKLEELSGRFDDVHLVQEELEILKTLKEDFIRIGNVWLSLLTDDTEMKETKDWIDKQCQELDNFVSGMEDFIGVAKAKIEQEFDNRSQPSLRPASRPCSKTSKSRSNRSDRSSYSIGLRESAKVAELKARAALLEKKQKIQNEIEKLEIQEKLAVAQARENAYSQYSHFAKEGRRFAFQSTPYTPRAPLEVKPSSPLIKPEYSPIFDLEFDKEEMEKPLPKESVLQFMEKQNQLTEILAKQHQQSLLPPLSLPKFSNDPLDYSTFMKCFEFQIEAKAPSSEVCLQYLEQHLEGEAKDLIKGCLYKEPHIGYSEAKKLLKEKYGDPYKISNAYIKRVKEWSALKPGDDKGLERLSNFLTQCVSAMESLAYLNVLDHPQNLQNLVTKLPYGLQDRWRREVLKLRDTKLRLPTFKHFAKFIESETKIACDPIFSRQVLEKIDRDEKPTRLLPHRSKAKQFSRVTSYATAERPINEQPKIKQPKERGLCPLCHNEHDLDECQEYFKKSLPERRMFLFENDLCYGCYKKGHRSRGCAQKRQCQVCSGCHPTGLHDYNYQQIKTTREADNNEHTMTHKNARIVIRQKGRNCQEHQINSMPIVPVRLWNNDTTEILTYAMLDSCSTGTFATEDTINKLNVNVVDTRITIRTINGNQIHKTKLITGLVVSDIDGNNRIQLPKTFTRDEIPASADEIPRPEFVRKWEHLRRIADKMPPYMQGVKVGLLIGTNCPKAIEPKDFVASKNGGPYAMLTFAGWTVVGPLYMSANRNHMTHHCSRIVAEDVCSSEPLEHHFKVENSVKEILAPETINKMFEIEFNERYNKNELAHSIEDKRFLEIVQRGTKHAEGHYELPLPFRDNEVYMPYNRDEVAQRTIWLKGKFCKNHKFYQDYVKFMKDIVDKGYASNVPTSFTTPSTGKVWYLPHHGVYHPAKKDKIRVVFNCSAKFSGISLNDKLLQGPDLTSTLIGVLTRFRKEHVAFMADIESMFYQVRVSKEHRNFLRYLWWPDGDLSKDLQDYQMNVHLFGAISSPSCSNYALKRIPKDFASVITDETADVLRTNFYVDDCLRSEPTEEKAAQRIQETIDACHYGGFHLTKIVSNSRNILQAIPEQERSKELRNINLDYEKLPVERALGMQWSVESDTFSFQITLKDKPLTRRGILSTISTIYDPLGIVAPVLLQGKRILQDLCKEKIDWDDQVPEEYRMRWEKWRMELPALERLQIARCFKPPEFGAVVKQEIHCFSDASFTGYGQVSYLRQMNNNGDIHCAFLMGKARLAPIKTVTIPRLELTAAVVSVKIGNQLAEELDYKVQDIVYWTDSTAVLKYINNDDNRYHVFVANRIQTIRDKTNPTQWNFVSGKENPADDASRGLTVNHFLTQQRWITGPDFLWKSKNYWPSCPFDVKNIDEDDPEVRVRATVVDERMNIIERFNYFSNWYKLKKAVARILQLKLKLSKKSQISKTITTDSLIAAETVILKLFQEYTFPDELHVLQNLREEHYDQRTMSKRKKTEIKKSSTLYRLDPFLDANGLLRIGGRLSKSPELTEDQKHPIILPKRGHITELIIRDAHQRMAHSGTGITLNELRNRYWIINGNSVVRWYIAKCVICRKLRANKGNQKMADLPEDRITVSPPFTFCAVDYFGPCMIKEGRKELKRYGVLFTCLASRAIHLETANSLETDTFINALRRFIARRGPVKSMRSDQGTNLVGAVRELRECLKQMDQERIKEYLLRHGNADWVCEWKFNPPTASHMGGSWERPIRTVRAILMALMREYGHALNDEGFRTLLTEVESIVNSKPLTFPSSDPDLSSPLTPNSLLTMKSKVALPPPGNFQHQDIYLRKQWRRVQYLTEIFWTRWKRDYLSTLQERKKWNHPRRNFKVGDVVLVTDDKTPRNLWSLARIVQTKQDSKGFVRSVKIRTMNAELERPIHKLVLILETD